MKNRPNKWLAAVLGFFVSALGLLYVARWRWAVVVNVAVLAMALLDVLYLSGLPEIATCFNLAVAVTVSRFVYVQARDFDPERPRPGYSRWPGLLLCGFVIVASIVAFRAFLYEPFRGPSGSMQPGISAGARLIVQKWGYGNYGTYGMHIVRAALTQPVERGDLMVFELPPLQKTQYIKRVVALPGDTLLIRDGRLTINGQIVPLTPKADYMEESSMRYIKRFQERLGSHSYDILLDEKLAPISAPEEKFAHMENCRYEVHEIICKVPEGHYYFMGDYRSNSFDSRYWGFVPQANFLGKVVYVSPQFF